MNLPNTSASDSRASVELSVVVPALNEEDNVVPLVNEVKTAILDKGISVELIVVDDGSTDSTLKKLLELSKQYPWVRALHRDKPQGQSAATYAGIQLANGKYVGLLDADLQNDPNDLAAMVFELRKGQYDMMQGVRARRKDTLVRKVTSWVGRTTRKLILNDPILDTGCSTRVMKIEFAKQLPLHFKGMHRFMPAYARMLGAKISEIAVNHRPRVAGVAKYGVLNRGFVGLIDCFAVRWMLKRYRNPAVIDATKTN